MIRTQRTCTNVYHLSQESSLSQTSLTFVYLFLVHLVEGSIMRWGTSMYYTISQTPKLPSCQMTVQSFCSLRRILTRSILRNRSKVLTVAWFQLVDRQLAPQQLGLDGIWITPGWAMVDCWIGGHMCHVLGFWFIIEGSTLWSPLLNAPDLFNSTVCASYNHFLKFMIANIYVF